MTDWYSSRLSLGSVKNLKDGFYGATDGNRLKSDGEVDVSDVVANRIHQKAVEDEDGRFTMKLEKEESLIDYAVAINKLEPEVRASILKVDNNTDEKLRNYISKELKSEDGLNDEFIEKLLYVKIHSPNSEITLDKINKVTDAQLRSVKTGARIEFEV